MTEIDHIDPTPEILTLRSGVQVSVSRVKTIQLLRLVKIFSAGDGIDALMYAYANSDGEEEMMRNVVSSLILAIPNAEKEVVEFIQSLVEPAHLRPRNSRIKEDAVFNENAYLTLSEELSNPDIEDLFMILETVVRKELPEFRSLGKRLLSLAQVAPKK